MPNSQDFDRALIHSATHFVDPRFHNIKVVRTRGGKLAVWRGQFCWVYRVCYSSSPGHWKAIRFFTLEAPETRIRYEALTDILRLHAQEFTTRFRYFADAYYDRNGDKHSVLEMDWVEGTSLLDQIKSLCTADDRESLMNLCAAWQELVLAMQKVGLAHGDLSGKNVMYSNGKLILIDYDGIYFADERLTGIPPKELGHPNYQHPERTGDRQQYDDRMDNFSALSIYASLLAYAEQPALAMQFLNIIGGVLDDTGDQLLFNQKDYANPSDSMAFEAVLQLPEGPARDACQRLKDACEGSLTQVPHFADVCDPLTRLRDLCSQSPPPWRAIYKEALRLRWDQNRPTPHKLSELNAVTEDDLVQQAILRCQTLDALITEIQKTPPKVRQIAIAFQKAKDNAIFDRWDEAIQYMAAGDQAESQCVVLDELEEAEASDPSGRELIEIWSKRKGLLIGTNEGQYWQRLIDSWEPVIEAIDHLFALTDEPPPWTSDEAVANAWEALDRVFSGNANQHPEIKSLAESTLSAIRAAHSRHLAHQRAKEVMTFEAPTESSDRVAVDCWDESLLKDCPDVSPLLRKRWRVAVKNVNTLTRLEQCVLQRDVTKDNEEELIEIASELPSGYVYRHQPRVETAVKRKESLAELNAALLDPVSDLALPDAYRKLQQHWGTQPQHCGLTSAQQQRIDRALRRHGVLQQIHTLLDQVPLDEDMSEPLDQQLAEQWGDSLFREPPESDGYCTDVLGSPHHVLQRANLSLKRINQLTALRTTIQQYEKGTAHSADLLSAAAQLTGWYLRKLQEYELIEQVQTRIPYIDRLEAAITDDFDQEIVRAWQKLKRHGIPPHLEIQRQRCESAVQRCAALEQWNEKASKSEKPEEEDQRRIRIYEAGDLKHLKITDTHRKQTIDARYQLALERRNAWQSLERAMDGTDDFEKRDCDNEELLAEYDCYKEISAELAQVRTRTEKARAMIDVLRELAEAPDDHRLAIEFVENFDCAAVKNHEHYFEEYRELIVQCIKEHLFEIYYFTNLKPSISEQRPYVPKVKWRWPANDKKISHGIVAARWGSRFEQDEHDNLKSGSLGDDREVCRREFNDENSTVTLAAMQDFFPPLHVAVWPAVKIESLGICEIGPMQRHQVAESPRQQSRGKKKGLWHSIREWIKRSLET